LLVDDDLSIGAGMQAFILIDVVGIVGSPFDDGLFKFCQFFLEIG
jgi:hypothetical protein